jgi:hypothetical protein
MPLVPCAQNLAQGERLFRWAHGYKAKRLDQIASAPAKAALFGDAEPEPGFSAPFVWGAGAMLILA